MSAAEFHLPTDADEAAELASIGIELQHPASDAQLDALVSYWLGEMAAADADLARYQEALDAEIARLRLRYDAFMRPVQARRAAYEQAVCVAAERADFGKKQSRAVGNGTYGRRRVPAALRIVDRDATLAWARQQAPHLVRQTIKEDVLQKPLQQWFEESGEVPDGAEYVAETVTYFAKPEAARVG